MTRPGAPGTVHNWPIKTELWLIRLSSESAAQQAVARALRREAVARGIQIEEVRCHPHQGPNGRRQEVLTPEEVRKLYVRCHRAHVWVAAVGGARWKLDPSQTANRDNLPPLNELVHGKAAGYRLVSRISEVQDLMATVAADPVVECTSVDDCRCLPLHVFSPGTASDLSSIEAREQFTKRYRWRSKDRKKCWLDESGRTWETARVMHTADQLHVTGLRLPIGFHWDVQTPRKRTILTNGWQRWESTNGGYLNVHPDAHVRSTHAQLVWSWDRPKSPRSGMGSRK